MDVSENGVYTQIDQIALIHGEYDYQPLENWGSPTFRQTHITI